MGIGFVGAVMAGVVADSVNKKTGRPGKFVLAMQRPSANGSGLEGTRHVLVRQPSR